MFGSYLEKHELGQLDKLLEYAAKDTINCWIATRINGASSSMACNGNVSIKLLETLDQEILPLMEKYKVSKLEQKELKERRENNLK